MQLRSYLRKHNIDIKEFAQKADINLQNLYYWLRGAYKPNKFYMRQIEEATHGQVTKKDWLKQKKKEKEDD